MSDTVLFWFRNDLRVADNPGLYEASLSGSVLPIYILEKNIDIGSASKWWLHYSLHKLNESLKNNLYVTSGDSEKSILDICKTYGIARVYWNRSYEPFRIDQDAKIQKLLEKHNISVSTYNGSLLWEPKNITKSDGTPYKVFTPFYRKGCLQSIIPRDPIPIPKNLNLFNIEKKSNIDDLELLSTQSWYKKFNKHWDIGEDAALDKLDSFLNS